MTNTILPPSGDDKEKQELRNVGSAYEYACNARHHAAKAHEKALAELRSLLDEIDITHKYSQWGYDDIRAMLDGELGDTSMAIKYLGEQPLTLREVKEQAKAKKIDPVDFIKELYENGSITIDTALKWASNREIRGR
jgi:hypothetical protein